MAGVPGKGIANRNAALFAKPITKVKSAFAAKEGLY
jgi:hypothetical protein